MDLEEAFGLSTGWPIRGLEVSLNAMHLGHLLRNLLNKSWFSILLNGGEKAKLGIISARRELTIFLSL